MKTPSPIPFLTAIAGLLLGGFLGVVTGAALTAALRRRARVVLEQAGGRSL